MKIFGTISELVRAKFRLSGGKEVTLEPKTPTESAVTVNFPAFAATVVQADLVTTADVGSITSAMIANGTITNDDINAAAGIVDTKLATISTAGKVSNSATTATDANNPSTIVARDASGNFSAGTITATLSGNATNVTGIVASANGGTGVNNGGTLTYGANNVTLTTSGATSLTLPTSGTVATLAGSETLLNKVTVSSTGLATGALTLPAGTTAEQPGSPVDGMIRYNTSNGAFEGRVAGAWSSIGGGGTTDTFTQASPVLAVGDVVYLNGSVYTKAIATSAATAEVVGVISKGPAILGANKYEITLSGEVTGLAGLTAGEVYFLSETTAGALTATEPSVIGQVSVPVGIASSTTSLYVAPKRGVVVGGANARTELPLSNNAATAIYTTPTGLEAGEIKGWVYIDATTDYRFFLSAQFARNGANSDWNLSYQTTGDTPPAGFNVTISSAANGVISIVLPNLAGFVNGNSKINYSLNAPAVGTTFPLTVAGSNVTSATTSAAGVITLKAPTQTKYLSGSGTYSTPAGVLYIKVKMVGGGGGGGGQGSGGSNGGTGGNTTFGSSLLTANGGLGGGLGAAGAGTAGTGGSASVGAGANGIGLTGGMGGSGQGSGITTVALLGGNGGNTAFGGAGMSTLNGATAAAANTGAGGGGAGNSSAGAAANSAGGGGAGGYVDAVISLPAASYSYAVGAGGTAGSAGSGGFAGGAGGSGIIIIDEYYY